MAPGHSIHPSLRCNVPSPRPDDEVAIANFDPDRVPAAVALAWGGIGKGVLTAELVCDAGRGAIEIAELANDLRPSTAVVGEPAQCVGVHVHVLRGRRPRGAPT